MIFSSRNNSDHQWLTVSDLMSGLMILFLFIAVSFMRTTYLEKERANQEKAFAEQQREISEARLNKLKNIAETYEKNKQAIYEALKQAFPKELLDKDQLNAEIDEKTLTFIFKSSDTLFDNASSQLKEDYKRSLAIFFPKYINAILPYKDSIDEIRIEGHTSSEWGGAIEAKLKSLEERKLYSYFKNMQLSQERTNSVLNYVLTDLKGLVPKQHHQWLRDNIAAIGLSSSKPILNEKGLEDPKRSRRVTFRIITNADSKIQQILHIQ